MFHKKTFSLLWPSSQLRPSAPPGPLGDPARAFLLGLGPAVPQPSKQPHQPAPSPRAAAMWPPLARRTEPLTGGPRTSDPSPTSLRIARGSAAAARSLPSAHPDVARAHKGLA